MKPLRWALALVSIAWPMLAGGAALAQTETEQQAENRLAKTNYALGGYYLGFEGLVAVENSAAISGDAVLVSGGGEIRLGYRMDRWLAIEISGLYIHTYGDGTGQFLAWGMSANGRVYLTRARVQPFVNVGLGLLQVRSRDITINGITIGSRGFDPGFAPSFGVGLEIYANESLAFTVMGNYYLTVGNISGLDFVTAGIGMMFF